MIKFSKNKKEEQPKEEPKQYAESTLRRLNKNCLYKKVREYEKLYYKLKLEYALLKAEYDLLDKELQKARGSHDRY